MIKRVSRFLKALLDTEKAVSEKIKGTKESAFDRFPIVFTLLGVFGLVATLYGFEGLIDKVDLFRDNPLILLGVGLGALILTGSLYDRLN
ncbi:TPA: hypothetical protein EYO12_03265 [Candidatus Saccharibacteria bacterium]|nr:hypothetical protein [Candidatus Saccharibacteria bacterium]HIO87947.1 hypothetical protein [Candidatus Saccharibacteria bacterium]